MNVAASPSALSRSLATPCTIFDRSRKAWSPRSWESPSAQAPFLWLDAPLLDYFPRYMDLRVAERRRITIRHALSMSAGLEWNEDLPYTDPKNDEIVIGIP